MINVVAFPWHNCTEECDVSVSSRLVSGGAEEAGMKGWRERAADIFAKQREMAAKMKSAPGPVPTN